LALVTRSERRHKPVGEGRKKTASLSNTGTDSLMSPLLDYQAHVGGVRGRSARPRYRNRI